METGEICRRQLKRREVAESSSSTACRQSSPREPVTARYWAWKLSAFGFEVKRMARQFLRPFVKSNKTDVADAQAIWEAARGRILRFERDGLAETGCRPRLALTQSGIAEIEMGGSGSGAERGGLLTASLRVYPVAHLSMYCAQQEPRLGVTGMATAELASQRALWMRAINCRVDDISAGMIGVRDIFKECRSGLGRT